MYLPPDVLAVMFISSRNLLHCGVELSIASMSKLMLDASTGELYVMCSTP
jgi:hypothetical protein